MSGLARKIVLTGGPGAGKTTAADLLRREIGRRIVVVPEAATMLFSGGFPRQTRDDARRAAQSAIFAVQRNLEDVYDAAHPERVLLCDRGTIDGAVYWPDSPHAFFTAMGTTLEEELERYDHVIFFETAAAGGLSIEEGNPVRIETTAEAVELDRRLRALWSKHPGFVLIDHETSFLKKILTAIEALTRIVGEP